MLKLGVRCSHETIRSVLRRQGLLPAPGRAGTTWRQFLPQHGHQILATDFFTVDTVWLQRLYVQFFVEIGSRRDQMKARPVTSAVYDLAVDIEEQELHYTPGAPLLGWRLFRVRACDEELVLSSPMYHDPESPPWPEVISEARCYEDHSAPTPGCRCGIYAAIQGTLDSLPGYLLDTVYERDPWAYAEVACTGRVFVDMRGVRAERAAIVRIALPDSAWPDLHAIERARRLLRKRYGVPIGGLDDVPVWVTGNRRDQGPPPDEVSLDLDLGKLDLWV